ncbi:hypothetical protein R1sor_003624 [Riccia sorocarpa]|uniref:Reverse transcriptase domain-containing protein n=1 Tax=Riccia sorocarpa TaxID=122646 RepID=A0ABD3H4W3_9MARC
MVRASFAPLIVDHGPLPLDGGLWIHFDLPDGRKMGLVALYAPNSIADRTSLWIALEVSLDPSRNWILAGDFNMITQQEDQIGCTPKLASGTEKAQWEKLLHTLDLRDTFKATDGALRFTWDNRRQAMMLAQEGQDTIQPLDAGRVLKRLDRIYVDLQHNLISTKILPGAELSEHLPAEKRKAKQTKLTLKVHGLLLRLQADPANVSTQLQLQEAQTHLATWETEKARWHQRHLDRLWEDDGDRSTKLFFNAIKARKKQTGFTALQDDHGTLHTEESKILDLAANYFADILQEPAVISPQHSAVDELLSRTSAQVTNEERESLQKDFTLQELHTAAKLLGRDKCPGPDGVPLEFFLSLWDTVSPLVLRATSEGLQTGAILPFFNRGTITLLQKEGDSTLLKNKRPITLLNAIYKIWAKGLQLRLSPVLQRLITWEQNAFIPGRQLHSTVMLCNEAIFEAKSKKVDIVLLSIDFRKAFDTLRWSFLYAALEKMQFGEAFIGMIKALNDSAESSVRINTSCSKRFLISRSVRQGCPLSPLLFTIAIQVFSDAVNSFQDQGFLKGINLPETGTQYCHGLFADDAHLLLQADQQNLLNAKSLLQTFGEASGLQVQWGKSKARWISESTPSLPWVHELDWVWIPQDEVDRFLGFQFREGLDTRRYSKLFTKKSLTGLTPRKKTNRGKIRALEGLILRFIWGGDEHSKSRHRVAETILHQPKREGGLGLISLQAQVQAFSAKTIRWAYVPGPHPLKTWLLSQFNSITLKRWGSEHDTWVSSPSSGAWPSLSPIMEHICKVWQTTAKLLSPLEQLPLPQWQRLSLWGPKVIGVRNTTRSANGGSYARLQAAGINVIGDITPDGNTSLPLLLAANQSLHASPAIHRAYEKVIDSTPKHAAAYKTASQYFTSVSTLPTWCIKTKDEAPMDSSLITAAHARFAFCITNGKLISAKIRDLPSEATWISVPVAECWAGPKKPPEKFLLTWTDKLTSISAMQWQDQTGFLSAPNSSIRRLAAKNNTKVTQRLQKWESSHHFNPNVAVTWSGLWNRKRAIKLSVLQWLIIFRVVPTNTWRFPQSSRDQPETWCNSCSLQAAEDLEHLFWRCPSITEFWKWAIDILHLAFPATRRWRPSFKHAILGVSPPDYCKSAARWWEQWRLFIIWGIWMQQNDLIFRNIQPSLAKSKALA